MANERRFTGIWIPAELIERSDLTLHEKFLAAEIDALDHPRHGCLASNEHFQNHMQLSERRIQEILSRLTEKGLIYYANQNGEKRVIKSMLYQWVGRVRDGWHNSELNKNYAINEFQGAVSRTGGRRIPHPPPPDTTSIERTIETTLEIDQTGINRIMPPIPETEPAPAPIQSPPANEATAAPISPATRSEAVEATQTPMEAPPAPRRRGRPPKSGLLTAPLFGDAGDYGPTDDQIYSEYPLKVRRPRAIEQIVKAVHRLTVKFRAEGSTNPEKSARIFLLEETKKYSEYRKALIDAGRSRPEYTLHPATFYKDEAWNDERQPIHAIGHNRNGNGNGLRRTAQERGQFPENFDNSRIVYGRGGENHNPFNDSDDSAADESGNGHR